MDEHTSKLKNSCSYIIMSGVIALPKDLTITDLYADTFYIIDLFCI